MHGRHVGTISSTEKIVSNPHFTLFYCVVQNVRFCEELFYSHLGRRHKCTYAILYCVVTLVIVIANSCFVPQDAMKKADYTLRRSALTVNDDDYNEYCVRLLRPNFLFAYVLVLIISITVVR
jgi:hypothetical protein